jgi:hypothetical protein
MIFYPIYFLVLALPNLLCAENNPFLRPGSNLRKPPFVQKSALPESRPISQNENLEFRGYYQLKGEWKFALFDKKKKRGFWLSQGERIDELNAEVKSFNPETDEVSLQGGLTLKLEVSDNNVLPVPRVQSKPPASAPKLTKAPKAIPVKQAIPRPRL